MSSPLEIGSLGNCQSAGALQEIYAHDLKSLHRCCCAYFGVALIARGAPDSGHRITCEQANDYANRAPKIDARLSQRQQPPRGAYLTGGSPHVRQETAGVITLFGGAAAVLLALLMSRCPSPRSSNGSGASGPRRAAGTTNRYTPFAVDTEKGASLNPTLWHHHHHV
jgi:hypothetical protein